MCTQCCFGGVAVVMAAVRRMQEPELDLVLKWEEQHGPSLLAVAVSSAKYSSR